MYALAAPPWLALSTSLPAPPACSATRCSEIAKRTNGLLDHYKKPHVNTASYQELYKESITKPDEFFDRMAKEHLSFDRPYKTILHGGFKDGDIAWFPEGGASAAAPQLPWHRRPQHVLTILLLTAHRLERLIQLR